MSITIGLNAQESNIQGLELPVALYLIENDVDQKQIFEVASRVACFVDDAHPEIANRLIALGPKSSFLVFENLPTFKQLNQGDVFVQLLDAGLAQFMIVSFHKFDKFNIADRIKAIQLLVDWGYGGLIEEQQDSKDLIDQINTINTESIRCGPPGSNTPIIGEVTTSTFLDRAIQCRPVLKAVTTLAIETPNGNFDKGTPEIVLKALQDSADHGANTPVGWNRSTSNERDTLTAETISKAVQDLELEVGAIELNNIAPNCFSLA